MSVRYAVKVLPRGVIAVVAGAIAAGSMLGSGLGRRR